VASAATRKVLAGGLNAMRGRFDNGVNSCPSEAGLLLSQGCVDFFSGQSEWNEDGLAASAVVGRQARQAVAAIDELFDCKEQESILRYR